MKCLSHVLTTFNPMLKSSFIAACVALCAAVVCVPAVAAPEDSMLANIKEAKARLDAYSPSQNIAYIMPEYSV